MVEEEGLSESCGASDGGICRLQMHFNCHMAGSSSALPPQLPHSHRSLLAPSKNRIVAKLCLVPVSLPAPVANGDGDLQINQVESHLK
jgi:hypothetical protein